MEMLEKVRDRFGALLRVCGIISGGAIFAVMCLVVMNVILRYTLNAPIAGTLELTESALPIIIFFSLAFTQYEGGHIRVVLLTQHFSPKIRRFIRVAALLAGSGLFAWGAWASWGLAAKSFGFHEMQRGSIRFPIWPIKMSVFFGLLLLSTQFLIDAIYVAMGGTLADSEEDLTQ